MTNYFMTDPYRPELIIIFDFGGFSDPCLWFSDVAINGLISVCGFWVNYDNLFLLKFQFILFL